MASLFLSPPPSKHATVNTASLTLPPIRPAPIPTSRVNPPRFRCSAGQTGFFTRLGRLIKEKAKSDVDKALLVADFGPRITVKIVDSLREDIYAGRLKSGSEIKDALKKSVLDLLTTKGSKTELQLGFRKPAVIMIVGVNGGGKTTSLGKLAHRLKKEGAKILMAAGDTFRAAASDQLEIWAERTGCEIVVAEKEKAKASTVLSQAVKRGKEGRFDVVLCDTSGRLHTNYSLMEELIACKKVISKVVAGAPNEILLVLDGTTGLNMLPQAREFNEVVGITGFILTKLDGSARGGCVVSVVDELGIPVNFVGVGEGVEDLQPFDAETFVNAVFS
ncbi:signal recognition particle receptor protein, chloroplast [Actinidia rufa]|uniref:Signal recognition particle receptor protein, chloroplast n=1 Tax=Actinidia rufa TaxID=165716 RepID=A0A7J0EV60_9ERIC|nr:signal recognition particle receptor protein, chloroplast [Actinidia rufa]